MSFVGVLGRAIVGGEGDVVETLFGVVELAKTHREMGMTMTICQDQWVKSLVHAAL